MSREVKTEERLQIRIERTRKARYQQAADRVSRGNPDFTLSDWVRQACDEKLQRDSARPAR